MKKLKVFLYHFLAFILGSLGIVFYFFEKTSKLKGEDGLIAIALFPAMIVFIVGFGILCLICFLLYLIFSYLKK